MAALQPTFRALASGPPARLVAPTVLASVVGLVGAACTDVVAELDEAAVEVTVTDPRLPSIPETNVIVERVVDGDSLEVVLEPDRVEVEVRLVGYNAPELFVDNERSCNGDLARLALESLLGQAQGATLVDAGEDRFGRLLADLVVETPDGRRSVVSSLVGDGVGLATGDNPENRRLMMEAAVANRGIWGDQCGAATSPEVIIADTQVDPEGNDRFNLADEWVRIANTSAEAITLDGWVLRDDTTGHRFPLSGSLGPSKTLTVRSGAGRSDGENLFLDESFPVWNNQTETVILIDPNGVMAHWVFVG